MKHLLKWVIPTVVLLLIGMWIGLNWDSFPANEQVYIPVEKKDIKYDTRVAPAVDQDSLLTTDQESIVNDETTDLATKQDSIDAAIAALDNNEIATEPVIIKEEKEPAQQLPSTKDVASTQKPVRSRTIDIEQPVTSQNRNITPRHESAAVKAKLTVEERYTPNKKLATRPPSTPGRLQNKQESATVPFVQPKKEIVLESYMSRRQIPVENLVTVDGTYKPLAIGKGVSVATFILHNRSGKNLKRVNLEVYYLGRENRLVKKVEMPVSNISADGTVSMEVPANAEAERLVYKVLYVSSALGDFYYEPLDNYASAMR